MPFKSEAQRRYMYSQIPEIAARWEKETPKGKKLPEKLRKAFGGTIPTNETALQAYLRKHKLLG